MKSYKATENYIYNNGWLSKNYMVIAPQKVIEGIILDYSYMILECIRKNV